jgi:hypothetical protein
MQHWAQTRSILLRELFTYTNVLPVQRMRKLCTKSRAQKVQGSWRLLLRCLHICVKSLSVSLSLSISLSLFLMVRVVLFSFRRGAFHFFHKACIEFFQHLHFTSASHFVSDSDVLRASDLLRRWRNSNVDCQTGSSSACKRMLWAWVTWKSNPLLFPRSAHSIYYLKQVSAHYSKAVVPRTLFEHLWAFGLSRAQ